MLTMTNLALGYDGAPVLHLNDVQLASGKDCLILGGSGSGKTTLLYTIAGLMLPLSGSIIIDGTDLASLSEAQRDKFRGRHIGIVFQTLHLVKSLTVLQNLLLAPYVTHQQQSKAGALEWLTKLGLADKADVLPQELSQGQAQRVAIARAVMNQPSLILADEPTSSLDDASCEVVLGLLKQAAKEAGATLLISTHDQRIKSHFSNVIQLGGRA